MSFSWFRTSSVGASTLMLLTALLATVSTAKAQDDDLPRVTRTFAITDARIVQAPGQVIERGTVVVRDGLIHAVGTDVRVPFDAQRIAGDSLTVYAGFIDGLSHAGIGPEERGEPQKAKNPGSPDPERAGILPERSAAGMVAPSDSAVAALRGLGFTTAHTVPRGEMLPGQGAIIQLGGATPEAMLLEPEHSLFVQFEGSRGSWSTSVYPSTPMAVIAQFRQLYHEATRREELAERYEQNPAGLTRPPLDPQHTAFAALVRGDRPAFFRADDALEIYRALALHEDLGFPIALSGIAQSARALDALAEADVPLFLTLALPDEPEEASAADTITVAGAPDDTLTTAADSNRAITPEEGSHFIRDFRTRSYEDAEAEERNLRARRDLARSEYLRTAAMLHEAGLRFGFSTLETDPSALRENLRVMIEEGLPAEAALAALTTDAADLLGISDRVGTIEEGKIANLVLTRGSYFDEDAPVRFTFVDGVPHEFDLAPADPSGSWQVEVQLADSTIEGTLTLAGGTDDPSGTIDGFSNEPAALSDVDVDGETLSFTFPTDEHGRVTARVTIAGDRFEGTIQLLDGPAPITGTRSTDPD